MPRSAKYGTVTFQGTTVPDVTDITVDDSVQVDEYASSSTAGQISREEGHEDTTGSFTMLDKPSGWQKGGEGPLVLTSESGVELYNGGAIITNVRPRVPIREGTISEWQIDFGQKIDASASNQDSGPDSV